MRACQDRLVRAVEAIADANPTGTVALVSHGDPIRLLLAHYAGIHLDTFQRLVVAPASVSAIAIASGRPHVLTINDTGDLAAVAGGRRHRVRGKVQG